MEKITLGHGLKPNIALGFASCYISLSTTPSCYGTAQMQGNTRARVARGSLAFCPRVTRDLLSSHSRFALESLAVIIFISTLMLPINHLL